MKKAQGFTLIELMVAVAIMALLAMLSWRGLDAMAKGQSHSQTKTDDLLSLQAGLAQWQVDLDALMELPQSSNTTPLDYDGQVLRLIRRYPEDKVQTTNGMTGELATESIRVVAWYPRRFKGKLHWLRWQSPALRTRAELQEAWEQAYLSSKDSRDGAKERETIIASVNKWEIYFYRNNAWSNALSSADEDGAISGSTTANVPDGVRLVLDLSSDQALVGVITRDWIRPTVGGGK